MTAHTNTQDGVAQYSTLRVANIARQREWDKENGISLEYRGNELAGEVGEACNIIKKLSRERLGIRGSRATKEQLAEELADVVICTDLIAMHEGIDLEKAVADKFNATSEKVGLKTRLSCALNTNAELKKWAEEARGYIQGKYINLPRTQRENSREKNLLDQLAALTAAQSGEGDAK